MGITSGRLCLYPGVLLVVSRHPRAFCVIWPPGNMNGCCRCQRWLQTVVHCVAVVVANGIYVVCTVHFDCRRPNWAETNATITFLFKMSLHDIRPWSPVLHIVPSVCNCASCIHFKPGRGRGHVPIVWTTVRAWYYKKRELLSTCYSDAQCVAHSFGVRQ